MLTPSPPKKFWHSHGKSNAFCCDLPMMDGTSLGGATWASQYLTRLFSGMAAFGGGSWRHGTTPWGPRIAFADRGDLPMMYGMSCLLCPSGGCPASGKALESEKTIARRIGTARLGFTLQGGPRSTYAFTLNQECYSSCNFTSKNILDDLRGPGRVCSLPGICMLKARHFEIR